MAGLTLEGFEAKDLQTILDEIEAEEHSRINASLDVSEEEPIGQVNRIFADQLDQAWQALAAVYAAAYRQSATGAALDAIGALTGTERLPARKTTVTAVAYGDASTSLSADRVASVAGASSSRFVTLDAATLTAPDAWASGTDYDEEDLVTNDTGKIYFCKVAGTSAGSGGPTGTNATITDNTVTWSYVATADAAVVVDMEAETTGPFVVSANSLTEIETPVSGWEGITNPEAGVTGRNVESDEDYRVRQEQSLTVQGSATVDAIRADLLELTIENGYSEDVTAAIVFENDTDDTDDNGLPPHSIECLVLGGDDQEIADMVWSSKAAGIKTYGTESATVTDSAGDDHTVYFSRPTEVPIYLIVDLTADEDAFPSDGEDQIKQALVDFWADKGIGDDVIRSQLYSPIDAIDGTEDITNIKLGTAPAPAGTSNITVTTRQLATFSTANITVNVTLT
jgi:uncharacterized phage protein gp47/JayE